MDRKDNSNSIWTANEWDQWTLKENAYYGCCLLLWYYIHYSVANSSIWLCGWYCLGIQSNRHTHEIGEKNTQKTMRYAAIGRNGKKWTQNIQYHNKTTVFHQFSGGSTYGMEGILPISILQKIIRFVHVYLLGDLTEQHSFNSIESIWILVFHKIYAIQNYMPAIWMKLRKYFNVVNEAMSLSNKIQHKDLLSWFPWNYSSKTFWNNLHRSMVIL